MSRYEEIKIGDKAEIKHNITENDINKFVALTGDDNKLHINKDYAAKTSFKKPVVHGMLSASFISTIIGTKIPGDGALWFSQTLEFILPVRIGDTISIIGEVIAKDERLNAIELKTDVFNQDKQKVITGKAKVKIIEEEIIESRISEIEKDKSKVALVIGGTGGIGTSVCNKLAEMGFNIAVHYYSNENKAISIVNSVIEKKQNAIAIQNDLVSEIEINDMVEKVERRIGVISLLVNCATVKIPNIKFENLEWLDIEKHININIKSNFYLAQKIVPGMKIRKFGKIIYVTTQYTEGTPPSELMHYVSSKYALNGFAKSLAVELASHNITVNMVSPGMTKTNLLADIPEKARLLAAAKSPIKRLANPEEVAEVIGFLASNKTSYITGETIRINGGQTMI
jgi:3-oxoacyl-[acyl-carrier protein] reductase